MTMKPNTTMAPEPAEAPLPSAQPTTEELQQLVESLDDVNTTKIPVVRIVPVEG